MNSNISPILIIGSAGFVGNYLIKECVNQKIETYGTKLPHEKMNLKCDGIFDLDLLKMDNIVEVLNKVKPKAIVNLSAQSSVGLSWKDPGLTIDVNIKGAVNLLEAVRIYDKDTRVLMISSSEEYGKQTSERCIIDEEQVVNPSNPYAVTKASQTLFTKLYNDAYHMNIITMRAFNHIGPGQNLGFVVPDFCEQIVDIESGKKEPIIKVGNLSAFRDFTDVRDIVKGYVEVLKHGKRNSVYNIGSGRSIEIKKILETLLSMAKVEIEVIVDPEKFRPMEVKLIEANISKIQKDVGYQPEISLQQTLKETLEYFRKKNEKEI